jgi:DNA-packaging protein gp3
MFKEGNRLYQLREKSGRDRIFENPNQLMDLANEYFKWAIDNPYKEEVVFHSAGLITKDFVSKIRPLTLDGLCIFIDIAKSTFQEYEKRHDFTAITTRIRQIIENQQFEGAACGFLNPNIIARKLGLTDKSEVKVMQEQPIFGEND